jgi:hydroxyethylthiazole kinase
MADHSPAALLSAVRAARPLVQNITNVVVTNFTANVLLAAGASPAMVDAAEEVADFVRISGALVINIGTLNARTVASMQLAAAAADEAGVPWVLDPVGAGATAYRTQTALSLLAAKPSVLRGNAGEIMALAGARDASQKGVDSAAGADAAIDAARALAQAYGCVVAITGETDQIVGPSGITAVSGGDAMIQLVTGTGCATTALVGAFLAVAPPEAAAVAALTLMKRATERAADAADGPGTLAVALLDALHATSPADLSAPAATRG